MLFSRGNINLAVRKELIHRRDFGLDRRRPKPGFKQIDLYETEKVPRNMISDEINNFWNSRPFNNMTQQPSRFDYAENYDAFNKKYPSGLPMAKTLDESISIFTQDKIPDVITDKLKTISIEDPELYNKLFSKFDQFEERLKKLNLRGDQKAQLRNQVYGQLMAGDEIKPVKLQDDKGNEIKGLKALNSGLDSGNENFISEADLNQLVDATSDTADNIARNNLTRKPRTIDGVINEDIKDDSGAFMRDDGDTLPQVIRQTRQPEPDDDDDDEDDNRAFGGDFDDLIQRRDKEQKDEAKAVAFRKRKALRKVTPAVKTISEINKALRDDDQIKETKEIKKLKKLMESIGDENREDLEKLIRSYMAPDVVIDILDNADEKEDVNILEVQQQQQDEMDRIEKKNKKPEKLPDVDIDEKFDPQSNQQYYNHLESVIKNVLSQDELKEFEKNKEPYMKQFTKIYPNLFNQKGLTTKTINNVKDKGLLLWTLNPTKNKDNLTFGEVKKTYFEQALFEEPKPKGRPKGTGKLQQTKQKL
jgi:hypothetical protein